MARVSAVRLRLRAPEGQVGRSQARTEEALRLAAPDDGRLLVLRRLDLGRMPVNAHPANWAGRAGTRMAALASRAVHAASPGASAAEAVWFRDEAEARRLLLAELAAGRSGFAWYWKLALPDWRGAPLADYLQGLIRAAGHDPERLVELAHAVNRIIEAGHLPALLAALPSDVARPFVAAPRAQPIGEARQSTKASPQSAAAALSAFLLFERLPLLVRRACLHAWHDLPRNGPAAAFLAEMVLLSAAPELAAQPALLAGQADRLTQQLLSADAETAVPAVDPQCAPPDRHADPLAEPGKPSADEMFVDDPAPGTATPEQDHPIADAAPAPDGIVEASSPFPEETASYHPEQGSAAAGLWLLIQPLARMGMGAWLDARPDLAAGGFARALLRHIAVRLRVPDEDPLFALLGEAAIEHDPALLAAWRIGLDRWLRRRVRRKLASVVMRRGWLARHETGIGIRFRVDQADIALRLRALDVDPGWVPWLGLSIAYHYRDEAWR